MAEDDPEQADATGGEGDTYVCGYDDTASTDDPCQFPVSDPGERCHMHPRDGSGPPENHGKARNGNELAGKRSASGGAPEGNRNAMSHGMYAAERDPSGLFDYFRESDPAMAEKIRRIFWTYMDDAPFDAYPGDAGRYSPPVLDVVDVDQLEAAERQQDVADDVDDLATVQVSRGPPRQHAAADAPPIDVQALTGKADRLFDVCVHQVVLKGVTLRQVKELLTQEDVVISEGDVVIDPTSGDPVQIEDELPVNLPKARMRQRDIRELKDLGVLDDPQSQTADAMTSWGEAVQRSAMRRDQDQDQNDDDEPELDR